MADQLCRKIGVAEGERDPGDASPAGGGSVAMAGMLSPEDELLVERLRSGLAKVAEALGAGESEASSTRAVDAALDGAELVMRGELLQGNSMRLPTLMPSFVFLVALPMVDHDRALELSRRTARLVEATLCPGRN
jgi:hypothetical protein